MCLHQEAPEQTYSGLQPDSHMFLKHGFVTTRWAASRGDKEEVTGCTNPNGNCALPPAPEALGLSLVASGPS